MNALNDSLNAFIDFQLRMAGAEQGPLAGLAVALSDQFAIAGRVTGAGSPDWRRTHAPEPETAPAVQRLLAAAASIRGVTHTDELAFNLNGLNHHYGTPVNPAAPDHLPGGSSSGSAAAVSGLAVDAALGVDTIGAVRAPASHCGVFGIRPSHGRIPVRGVMPICPSFDAVGWLTRSAHLLAAIGDVLLDPDPPDLPDAPRGLLVAQDALAEADPEVRAAFQPVLAALDAVFGPARWGNLAPAPLADLAEAGRVLMRCELNHSLGAWIDQVQPTLGPGLDERLDAARRQPAALVPPALEMRRRVARHVYERLTGGIIAAFPTMPAPPPRRNAPREEREAHRLRVQRLTWPAELAGAPQVNLPAVRIAGAPVGLALVAEPGADRLLMKAAMRAAVAIADTIW